MKALLLCTVLGCLLCSTVGCAGFLTAPVVPPTAVIYTDMKAPMDVDLNSTSPGSKSGSASTQNILGLVSWGDASVEAAAADGGIGTVNHADYQFFNILGIYSKFTTVVHGD